MKNRTAKQKGVIFPMNRYGITYDKLVYTTVIEGEYLDKFYLKYLNRLYEDKR